jgi:hypothetical protein
MISMIERISLRTHWIRSASVAWFIKKRVWSAHGQKRLGPGWTVLMLLPGSGVPGDRQLGSNSFLTALDLAVMNFTYFPGISRYPWTAAAKKPMWGLEAGSQTHMGIPAAMDLPVKRLIPNQKRDVMLVV